MSLIPSLGFIGAGKVAKIMAQGFISAGIIKANEIFASSIAETDLEHFRNMGCNATNDNKLVMKESKLVFLATQAKVFPQVFKEISPVVTRNHLLASIAAGVTLEQLQNSLPDQTRVVRMMLNSAVQFREGVTAAAYGKFTQDEDITLFHELMSSVGYCAEVKEDLMDLMTALTGGGPAYMYVVIDALADGAVRAGLNRQEAVKLVAQTAAGAAQMVIQSGKHIGELKDSVCTAGGSTIAGINALEDRGLRGALMRAIHDATDRAKEIRKNST
ncbi:hypothetical protein OS493_023071 [Desmophyllum pertusum]|uniref:Pyrroline-5-carboxylate reductase n=1 Tax=Desmophyllum pertusum TaxID=174260 RepID=A0A9W9YYH7_9CNID|nr:hypothetical protein OS493_023071 [Desmophyllum pertusum]